MGERRGGGESGLSLYLQRANYFVLLRTSEFCFSSHPSTSAAVFHHLFCVNETNIRQKLKITFISNL